MAPLYDGDPIWQLWSGWRTKAKQQNNFNGVFPEATNKYRLNIENINTDRVRLTNEEKQNVLKIDWY